MLRRGSSEAVSVVILAIVISTSSYYALSNSSQRITDNQRSAIDMMNLKNAQTQELISIISRDVSQETITLEMVNFGTKTIVIDSVFVDSIKYDFVLSNSTGYVFDNDVIPVREIMVLRIFGTGQSIQIITDSKNMIALPLP